MENGELDNIKKKSAYGTNAIIKIYCSVGLWRIFWRTYFLPLFFSLIILIVIVQFASTDRLNLYNYIDTINDVSLSVISSLIGFNLGAFALFIAFGGSDFLKTIVEYKPDKTYSLYQRNSAIFSMTLFIQLITIIFSVAVKSILSIGIVVHDIKLNLTINSIVTFFIIFLGLCSIITMKDIIVNIWNISQGYHFNLWQSKYKDELKNKNNNP